MCGQRFRFGENLGASSKPCHSGARDLLHAEAFYKIGRREPAAPPRPACSRQHVIASGDVIAEWLSSPRSQEDRSRSADFAEQLRGIGRQTQMFRREAVDELARALHGRSEQNGAGGSNGLMRGAVRRQGGELLGNFGRHFQAERAGSRDQKARGIRRMLSLREKVRGNPARVAAIGSSGPTICRTRSNRTPSGSSSAVVSAAPCAQM